MQMIAQAVLTGGVRVHPPAFFDWLYGVDWYGGILRDWVFGLPENPAARVLDLGCGPGGLARDMAARGWQVTGADRSKRMIGQARRRGGAALLVGDALALPFGDNAFDVVLSASLINLVPDRVAVFAEMARVLRPGGVASVLFPTPSFGAREAADMPLMSGAALRLWAGAARQCDPVDVQCAAETAGLRDPVAGGTSIDGVATVTARAP